ncbi:MAG TPA: histidine kinase dimerization/phospho-acceptor domain-containing protein, partial [bacterium]
KHEISNPLLLIIGHAQLLLAKSDRLPAEAVKKLEKILNNAEKIRGLLQERQEMADLLQVSDEYNVIEQS